MLKCLDFSVSLCFISNLSDALVNTNRTVSGPGAQDLIESLTVTLEQKMGEILVPIIDLWLFHS